MLFKKYMKYYIAWVIMTLTTVGNGIGFIVCFWNAFMYDKNIIAACLFALLTIICFAVMCWIVLNKTKFICDYVDELKAGDESVEDRIRKDNQNNG